MKKKYTPICIFLFLLMLSMEVQANNRRCVDLLVSEKGNQNIESRIIFDQLQGIEPVKFSIFQKLIREKIMEDGLSFSSSFEVSDRNAIEVVVSKVDKFLGTMKRPRLRFKQTLDGTNLRAKYEPGPVNKFGTEISGVEYIDVAIGKTPESRASSLATVAHEVGHAIFDVNLIMEISGSKWSLQEWDRYLSEKIKKLNIEMQAVMFQEDSDIVIKKIWDELVPLQQKYKLVKNTRKDLVAYNELFADLIAVSYADNLKVMAEALGLSEEPPFKPVLFDSDSVKNTMLEYWKGNPNGRRPRDFSIPFVGTSWVGDPKLLRYTMFEPIRSHLGLYYRKVQSKQLKIEVLLQGFIDATFQHLELRRDRNESFDTRSEDTFELNQEFIEILDTLIGSE